MEAGYAIHESVFSPHEIRALSDALVEAAVDRTRAGARHVLAVGAVRHVAHDERMMQLARLCVGIAPVPFRATLFDKSAVANWLVAWHQDLALPLMRQTDDGDFGPWSRKGGILHANAPAWALEQVIALRVSLDASSSSNGPLRVLPDTHTRGVLSHAEIEHLASSTTPVECLTDVGGVVAMRPLLLHASSKATSRDPRRVLHIEYARASTLAPGIDLVIG